MPRLLSTLVAALLVHSTSATYTLATDYSPTTFFDHFGFFDGDDPTHGTVEYQSRQGAKAKNLISTTDSTVRIGVDSTNKVDSGRPSVRLFSNTTYNHGILLVDVKHMPAGCGTWPALWMLGDGNWPDAGEIDIIEGANDQANNYMTLHTSDVVGEECSLAETAEQTDDGSGALGLLKKDYTGTVLGSSCAYNLETNDNTGCQVHAPEGTSSVFAAAGQTIKADVPTFGGSLNSAAGGTLAMQWTSTGIKIWFFGRTQAKPADVAAAIDLTSTVSPVTLAPSDEAWGEPMAHFSGSSCDWEKRFYDMRIVINTDFCGDWGAGTWSTGQCPSQTGYDSCEKYVQENPQAFTEAYWEFGAFRWFDWEDPAPPAPTTTSSASSSTTSTSSSTSTPSTVTATILSTTLVHPTVVYTTVSTRVTSRPFTYDPLTTTAAETSSSTEAAGAASTTATASTTAAEPTASSDESKKGDAQYLVNGKLPLGGAGSVVVPWAMMQACVGALTLLLGGIAAAV